MGFKTIIIGIAIIVSVLIVCFLILDNLQYDIDCLNKIANKVCKENSYGYGEMVWDLKPVIHCYTNNRALIFREGMRFTKQELSQCK